MRELAPGAMLIGARCIGYFFAAPLFGEKFITPRLRIVLALLIAVLLAPLRPAPSQDVSNLIAIELLFGLMAGFVGKVMLAGAEVGGQMIGLSMGLGFAGTFDPTLGEESLPTRKLIYCLSGLVFLMAGGLESTLHVLLIAPLTSLPSMLDVYQQGGEILAAGLRVAAPVMLSAIVVSIASALVSRASPAMNLFSLSLPILLCTGGVVFILSIPGITQEILLLVRRYMEAIQ